MLLPDTTNKESAKLLVEQSMSMAREAGLRYVGDAHPGFTRKRHGKSFRYFDPQGRPLRDPDQLKRIKSLVIPPAWSEVWICRFDNGHIQATGRDAKGRKQYRYHAEWARVRGENKYCKLLDFGRKLPSIRRRIKQDLAKPGMCREKVLAAIVQIMEKTTIRIGNDEYARKNKSYGLTTIRNHHVKVRGSKIHFHFKGKSGIVHDIDLEDKQLARIVRKCQDLPGQELFAYQGEDGQFYDVESGDVNEYLKEISGECFTAKDYRTWGGTLRAARVLRTLGPAANKKVLKKCLLQAVQETASHLGNTPTVCKKYYIHPCLLEAYEEGRLFDCNHRNLRPSLSGGLRAEERFVLNLIQQVVQPG